LKVSCYTALEIDDVEWPETADAQFLRRYITPFMVNGSSHFIENTDTDVCVLVVDGLALPYTVASRGEDESYVTAPQSHYIDCAKDEIAHLDSASLRLLSSVLVWPLRRLAKWGKLNKVVMVNNWLLSTNLYASLTRPHIKAITETLQERYPDHSVLFRSIDLGLRRDLFTHLKDLGAKMVMSRRVHILFDDDPTVWNKNNIKNDQRLQRRTTYSPLEHDELCEDDMGRIHDLYEKLYIDKYSHYNPKFTTEMITHLWRERLWCFRVHRRDGVIDAVAATFGFNGVRTAPLLGYDTEVSQKEGLYRLAYLDMIESGRDNEEIVHCSAGVAAYKQARGARSFMEYNAVFNRHLPMRQRLPWLVLRIITKSIISPMMLRNNL